ncbi:NOL1/NOP2/sun family putative RNA methylase, partial [Candidatus Bathyarchaeota archaeon]|nr:NOL1/NOP2/sun family putative RNA methylase [Candidatus Bathyarchaeota archaeon]
GGKTTYAAAMMRNTGLVVANDANKNRAKSLVANVARLGAQNVVISNHDAKDFPQALGLIFDRVLLDAPCSGTGVISKDANVKTNKTERDFMVMPHVQKQLLLAAIDSVRFDGKGEAGVVVYSTCSVTVEENEQVVQFALNRRPNVRLVETGLPFGKEGFTSFRGKRFDPTMSKTMRYYPHTYNVDGFFVAKLKKVGPDGSVTRAPREKDDGAVVDRAPVVEEASEDEFGGFDEEADEAIIEKGQKNAMRRRGLDPKARKGGKKAVAKTEEKTEEKTGEKTEEKTEEKKEVKKVVKKDVKKVVKKADAKKVVAKKE